MGAVDLPGVRHHHLHGGGAGEHLEHQFHVADAGVVQAGELQVQHLPRHRLDPLPRRGRRLRPAQGIGAVAQELGGLLVPDGQPPLHHHRLVLLQIGAAGLQHPGEAQQLHGGGVILHRHVGHQGVVLGGLGLAGGDDAADGDPLVVGEPGGSPLLGEVRQDGADGGRPQPPHRVPVLVHGVAGEVEAGGLLLHQHQLLRGVLVDIWQGYLLYSGLAVRPCRHGEEVHLPLQVLAVAVRHRVHDGLVHLDQLGPPGPQGVKGAGADQVLHRPLVDVAVRHPVAEVVEGREGALLCPVPHHRLDEAPADVLDGHQAEADASLLHGEPVGGAVDVRRQQGDAAVPALADVPRHLVGVVQYAGQQGRHVLPGVVALEPGGLVGHHRVGDGVGLVEGVLGEGVDLLVDGLGGRLRDAVGHTSRDAPVGIPVDEGRPLPLDLLALLLAHGPADHVGLAQGVPRQLLEDLHHLLLVDDAPVGDGQDGLQGGVLVGHPAGVVLAGDEPGDGFHGAGPVQGHDGGQVLDGLGPQAHAHAGHAGGLHLEHAGGLSGGEHLIGLRVVLRDVRELEVRLALLDHLHRVVQHRQVPQAQEVHFQKAQFLQGGHHVLADHCVVVFGQGHIVHHRPLGDHHAGGVGGGMAGHPLQGPGGVDELFHLLVGLVLLPQGLGETQGVV